MNDICRQKIGDLFEVCKAVCVTSVDEDGYPHTKAMFPARREGLKVHYFSTNASSRAARRFERDGKASVCYLSPYEVCGLSLTGTVEICRDARSRELIWREGDEQYYPLGVTDPDYIVYKFTAHSGTLWFRQRYDVDVNATL